MELLPDDLQRSVKLASEKGSSTWLTVMPLSGHSFTLHKAMTPWHYDTAGHQTDSPWNVCAVPLFQLNMQCPALKVAFHQSGKTRYGTWQPPFSQKCATMYALSRNFSLWPTRNWQVPLPTHKQKPALILLQMVFGDFWENLFWH